MEHNGFLIYSTYVIIYANDTACNVVLELEKYIADEDKEPKKIYRALKRRALSYLRYFNNLSGELSWFTSEYFSSMDETNDVLIERMYDEIECFLVECGAEKPKLYAKLEQARILCHTAVKIHNMLMDECRNRNINTYNLESYRLSELIRVVDNLSEWTDRHFKSETRCDMTSNENIVKIMQDIANNLMSYENFLKSYENSCNVNSGEIRRRLQK